jgi:hypothetical protein
MAANVRSLDAIAAVRAAMLVFQDELDQALTAIDVEVRHVLDWLEHDRPRYWKVKVREAGDAVTEARAALHRCLMYPINDERPSCYEERAELEKAESRLAYCLEKSERLQHWKREVRHEKYEYQGRISQLKDVVGIDVPQAVVILDRLMKRIEEYQSISRPADGLAASAASESFARELMPDPVQRPPEELVVAPAAPAASAAESESPDDEEAS